MTGIRPSRGERLCEGSPLCMASPLCLDWCLLSTGSRHRQTTWPIPCSHCSLVRLEWRSRSGLLKPRGLRMSWQLGSVSGSSVRPVSWSEHSPLPGGCPVVPSSVPRSSWADFWWEQTKRHFQHPHCAVQPSLKEPLRRAETPSKSILVLVGIPFTSSCQIPSSLHGSLDTPSRTA